MPVAILADLQGPRVRVRTLPGAGIPLEARSKCECRWRGQNLKDSKIRDWSIDKGFLLDIRHSLRISVLGLGFSWTMVILSSFVEKVENESLLCTVITGGFLKSHKGVNFPGKSVECLWVYGERPG